LQRHTRHLQQHFYSISHLKLIQKSTSNYIENIQSKLWFSGPFVPLFGSEILKKCCCKWQVCLCNLYQLYIKVTTDNHQLIQICNMFWEILLSTAAPYLSFCWSCCTNSPYFLIKITILDELIFHLHLMIQATLSVFLNFIFCN
jgi:hypothetical protein